MDLRVLNFKSKSNLLRSVLELQTNTKFQKHTANNFIAKKGWLYAILPLYSFGGCPTRRMAAERIRRSRRTHRRNSSAYGLMMVAVGVVVAVKPVMSSLQLLLSVLGFGFMHLHLGFSFFGFPPLMSYLFLFLCPCRSSLYLQVCKYCKIH